MIRLLVRRAFVLRRVAFALVAVTAVAGAYTKSPVSGWVSAATANGGPAATEATPVPAGASPAAALLLGVLSTLPVAEEGSMAGYSRDLFPHWADADENACDTRCDVLVAQRSPDGTWFSSYDQMTLTSPDQIQIDHVVPLADAYRSGAASWTTQQRTAFANDMINPELVAVSAASNQQKSDLDPAEWMPAMQDWCPYLASWLTVKSAYGLSVDPAERAAIINMAATC